MLNAFLTYINANQLFTANDKLLVAVSGGKDSMVLLGLLQKTNFNVAVAHVNFGLRGDASDTDEDFVRNYCSTSNIPFFCERFETKKYAKEHGISTQMAARELRYTWFQEVRKQHGFDYVLTAHHRSDNLETTLLNLTRGTGISGLTGIAPKQHLVVRPLLFLSRSEIDSYAKKHGVKWREDASNTSEDYHRNLLRHKIIPTLKVLNISVERTFERTLERLRAAEFAWNEYLENTKKKVWKEQGGFIKIDTKLLQDNPHVLPILEALLKPYGFTWQQLLSTQTAAQSSRFLTDSHTLFIERNGWILAKNSVLKSIKIELKGLPERLKIGNINLQFELIEEFPPLEALRNPQNAFFDFEKLQFPLCIRTWQIGDRFSPYGMKGSMLLSDYFINEKLTNIEKETQLLLTDNTCIAWVVGKRVSQKFAIREGCRKILKVKVE